MNCKELTKVMGFVVDDDGNVNMVL